MDLTLLVQFHCLEFNMEYYDQVLVRYNNTHVLERGSLSLEIALFEMFKQMSKWQNTDK